MVASVLNDLLESFVTYSLSKVLFDSLDLTLSYESLIRSHSLCKRGSKYEKTSLTATVGSLGSSGLFAVGASSRDVGSFR